MIAKQEPGVHSSPTQEVDQSPIKSFYANNAGISISIYDIGIILRSGFPITVDGVPKPELGINTIDSLIVHMSPQHAKSVAILLTKAVERYETEFNIELPTAGEIKFQ